MKKMLLLISIAFIGLINVVVAQDNNISIPMGEPAPCELLYMEASANDPFASNIPENQALATKHTTTWAAQKAINLACAEEYVLTYQLGMDSLLYKEDNYLLPAEQRWIDNEQITPETWRWVKLELAEADGSISIVKLRRPLWWFEKNNIKQKGDKVYLNLPTLHLQGAASVADIWESRIDSRVPTFTAAAPLAYRPIIGWFERTASRAECYVFSSGDTIVATPIHPFFSEDRQDYIPAKSLRLGENVRTRLEGRPATLLSKFEATNQPIKVYNLEVWRDHNYHIGNQGLLVHNECKISEFVTKSALQKRELIATAWKILLKKHGYNKFYTERLWFEKLMGHYRYTGGNWKSANAISPNFKGIDFYEESSVTGNVIQASRAVSMKTTSIKDIDWLLQQPSLIKNVDILKVGLTNGIAGKGQLIKFSQAEIHIYIPEENVQKAISEKWIDKLKQAFGSNIKFEVSSLEHWIGI